MAKFLFLYSIRLHKKLRYNTKKNLINYLQKYLTSMPSSKNENHVKISTFVFTIKGTSKT